MARISIVFYPELGHLTPIGQVAQRLRQRGHSFTFITVPDAVPLAERYGWPVAIVGEDEFPPGSMAATRALPNWRELRRRYRVIDTFLIRLARGDYDGIIRDTAPDLCLTDSLFALFALRAYAIGIPAATYCTSLPDDLAPGVPRLDSELLPHTSPWLDVARDRAGRVAHAIKEGCKSIVAGKQVNLRRLMASTARRIGYPSDQLQVRGPHGHMLRAIPEVVLCSPAFDFPRPPRPNRVYLGPCVDPTRPESGAEAAVHPDRPFVYVSLGSQTYRYGTPALRVYEYLVAAAARLPFVDFLVVVEPRWSQAVSAPANVTFVEHAAQMAALRRAALFVTHGGLGSVKEAMVYGVPMVVVPMVGDQHGNAARVEYHGLGVRLRERDLGADSLEAAIRRLLTDESCRARVRAMRDRMRPTLEEGCELFERTFGLEPAVPRVPASSSSPLTYEEVRQ